MKINPWGPFTEPQWQWIEDEIEKRCEEAGLSPLQRYSASFTLDLATGEIKLDTPPR